VADFGAGGSANITFFGGLSGTSASFSSTIIAGLPGGNIQLKGSIDGFLGVGVSDNTLYLMDWVTSTKGLKINLSTGGATFSSNILTNGGTIAALNGGSIEVYNSGNTNYFDLKSVGGNFALRTNINVSAVNALTIAAAGAATFSSSISAGATNGVFTSTGTTTAARFMNLANTSGDAYFGIENSTGGSIVTGSVGYDTIIRGNSGISFSANAGSSTNMRLTSGGNLLIGGTTTNMPTLYVHGPNNNGNTFRAGNFFTGAQSGGTDYPIIGYNTRFTSTSTILYEANDFASYIYFGIGRIDTYTASSGIGGNAISATRGPFVANNGTTWTNGSSDVRLKKNFETTQGLSEILKIEPIKYHFNYESDLAIKRLGFKAQNLQKLIPEMVVSNGDTYEDGSDILTYIPDYLLPILVKAIQEQQEQIEELKALINK
jgi:hypothetical protein